MKKSIFRQSSLENMISNDKTNKEFVIVSSKGWLALLSLITLLIGALYWGFNGTVLKKVSGNGMFLYGSGIKTVTNTATGRIRDLSVCANMDIKQGQVLARVYQDEVTDKISDYKDKLDLLKSIPENIDEFNPNDYSYDIYTNFATVLQSYKSAKEELASLKSQIDELKKQATQNAASLSEQYSNELKNQTMQDNSSLTQQYNNDLNSQTNQEISSLTLQYNSVKKQIEEYKKEYCSIRTLQIKKCQNQLDQMADQLLSNDVIIKSNVNGRIIEMNYSVGDYISEGSTFCSVAVDGDHSNTQSVILYVPATTGKVVTAGMDVNICPTTVNKEEYGYILGQVKSVSDYIVSQEYVMKRVCNEVIVQQLLGDGAVIELEVNLLKSDASVSGYKWSTREGPNMNIVPGTICTGEIKIESVRPIDMFLPFLKKMLPRFD